MPRELNLTPLWFHRLDAEGNVLEADALWPILHYERTAEGGHDFRVRPLYRRVTEPAKDAVEHQFLWPLGRVRSDAEESSQRLFPLWSWRSRVDQDGRRDVDWYALFPFVWGGGNEAGDEDYFAVFPIYADIPQFLTYDRFHSVLFPLYVGLEKDEHRHRMLAWPLIGFSDCGERGHEWFRVFPLYGHDLDEGRHVRRFALWPFFAWGEENQDAARPVSHLWIWPLFGARSGESTEGIALLWPLYESVVDRGGEDGSERFRKTNVLWPLFHYYGSEREQNLQQWWLWPLVGHAKSDDQDNWSFLWPLIWWRDYLDPDAHIQHQWILPLFWRFRQDWKDGASEDHVALWPIVHRTVTRDAEGAVTARDWSLLSLLPWRGSNGMGFEEAYGFLWQVARGRQRSEDDRALDVLGRAFTRREQKGQETGSMPFLFNYETGGDGTTLRLLQFLPIRLSGPDKEAP